MKRTTVAARAMETRLKPRTTATGVAREVQKVIETEAPARPQPPAPRPPPPVHAEAPPAAAPEAEPAEAAPDQPPRPIRRRDSAGHPDPEYVADLLAKSGRNLNDQDDKAFLDRPQSDDDFAEERGEDFIQGATSGEDADEQVLDPSEPAPEESGFVITTGREEFGREPDASNPEDAEVEPFPTTRSEG